MIDYYQTLAVPPTASSDEIKSQYRKLAKEHHPDLGGNPEQFKAINEAYSIIGDPEKRVAYDTNRTYTRRQHSQQYQPRPEWSAFTADEWFHTFHPVNGMPRKPQRKNPNIRMTLELPLASIVNDQTRMVRVNNGNGQSIDVQVRIPKGVHSGAVISYKGMGKNIYPDAPSGDLLIEVTVLPDPNFVRDGYHITSNVTIDAFHAILGGDIEFRTIRGKTLRINVPAGTQHGKTLRISGLGLPSDVVDVNGDQFIKISVHIPTNLTVDELELVKKIKELTQSR